MQGAIKPRASLLDFNDITDEIERFCAEYGMGDEGASYEFKKRKGLKIFAYKLRCEAAHCKSSRLPVQEAREDACINLSDEVFEIFLEDAQALGYLRLLTDVTKQITWVFA